MKTYRIVVALFLAVFFLHVLPSACLSGGGELVWEFETGNDVKSSPAVADGYVYVGSNDKKLYCLDAKTGEEVWSEQTDNAITSSPAVSEGQVYVGSLDGNVYSFDSDDGGDDWDFDTEDNVKSSPTVYDDYVYIGSDNKSVYKLSASTGSDRWQFMTEDEVESTPAVVDNYVYFGCNDEKVYCVFDDGNDVTEEWDFETEDEVKSSPAVVDDYVYIGSDDKYVYCLDADDGDEEWKFQTGGSVESSPAVVDGYVYVGSNDKKVYCLKATTSDDDGEKVWEYETGKAVKSSPAVADGYVYIGSGDGKLYCLNAETGEKEWEFATGDEIVSSPAVADGYVYVGSSDDKLYCITAGAADNEPDDEPENTPPTVTISAPTDNASFAEDETITFSAVAVDSEDGALSGDAIVWTSDKDGQVGTGASFISDSLSIGTHIITVTATDSQGDSGTDTITIRVQEAAKVLAQITSPEDNETVVQGEYITFEGTAAGPDGTVLSGDALVWISSLDGQIGTGESFVKNNLSPGEHTITLTATDPDGVTGTDSILVRITEKEADDEPTTRCPFTFLLQNSDPRLDILRQFRDSVLAKTPLGTRLIYHFYAHSEEIISLFNTYPVIKHSAQRLTEQLLPTMRSFLKN